MDVRQGLPTMNHLLQHTLRRICTESQWVYAVFWRILPRNYPPPQWETDGGMDRSKGNKRNCFSACAADAAKHTRRGLPFIQATQPQQRGSDDECEAMSPELFFKMSHEVYNYGEGLNISRISFWMLVFLSLMGKVAADSSHKWIYREPVEHEVNFLAPWHSTLEPHPRTWEAQFKSGIQTIAVVAVQEGVLQLGSTKKIMEDLNFVLHLQRKFNYLQSIPGVFVPHPMSCAGKKRSTSDGSPPSDRYNWMTTPEVDRPTSISHLTARSIDQFLSPRIGPQLWRSSSDTTVLGVKRPPESEPLSLSFKDCSYMNGSDSFHHRPECPYPPKSLNTGHTSPQGGVSPTIPNLLPSMSSLQALLSKLPSVTPTEGEGTITGAAPTTSGFETGNTFVSNSRPPVSRPAVTKPVVADSRSNSSKVSPSIEIGNGHLEQVVLTKVETEPLQGKIGAVASSSPSSGNSDVASAEHASDDTEGHQTSGTSKFKDSHKFSSSFLDTFENLADFGTHLDVLESGDSYNSFLNEIYS
ncbi:uncharacterized protein [Physcomitrium patens]|uniref:uncharacterized protein isoform X2 n=1 Tax=Physcomitrium patens TaxID=3218 RepID=UPI000D165159|nr:uncharacterized protein LOC112290720 isoform X2 [Physcomitrium patens]|eukprot:XP_024393110.1 uncharacterized protein LOC112290720 isoform X2 [Physcomitrella patens]